MAECFCGCGRKIKFTRRAMNSTGRLVGVQLGAWGRLRPSLERGSQWSEELSSLIADGRTISDDLAAIMHGGPLRLTVSQRQITRWLTDSRKRLVAIEAEGPEALPGAAEREHGDERETEIPDDALAQALSAAERRAELERLQAEYEAEAAEEDECEACGVRFSDRAEFLAHLTDEHSE